jgi:hypothetical protein
MQQAAIEQRKKEQAAQFAAIAAAQTPGRAGAQGSPVSMGTAYAPPVQMSVSTNTGGGYMGVPGLNAPPGGSAPQPGTGPLNEAALASLSPEVAEAIRGSLKMSRKTREQKGFLDEWQQYRAALANQGGMPPEGAGSVSAAPEASGGTSSGYNPPNLPTGVVSGNIRALYNQMGGMKSGVKFEDFKTHYLEQTKALGADLKSYIDISGLKTGLPGAKGHAGAGSNVLTAGSDIMQYTNLGTLSPQARDYLLAKGLGGHSLDEGALAFMAAGGEQYKRNKAGEGGEALPGSLRNVSYVDPRYDQNALQLMLNALLSGGQGRIGSQMAFAPPNVSALDEILQSAYNPYDTAEEPRGIFGTPGDEQGLPFPGFLFGDENLNLTDPSAPFIKAGQIPVSLFGLHGGQAGELGFLASLALDEFIKDVYPYQYAQENRPAGAEAPYNTLMFGSPVTHGTRWVGPPGDEASITEYEFSPLMGARGSGDQRINDMTRRIEGLTAENTQGIDMEELGQMLAGGLYNRYGAWGMPGDATQVLSGAVALDPQARAEAASREYLGTPWYDKMVSGFWADNPLYRPYRELSPEVAARYAQLMRMPYGPGTAF